MRTTWTLDGQHVSVAMSRAQYLHLQNVLEVVLTSEPRAGIEQALGAAFECDAVGAFIEGKNNVPGIH